MGQERERERVCVCVFVCVCVWGRVSNKGTHGKSTALRNRTTRNWEIYIHEELEN